MNAQELKDLGIDPVILANIGLSIPNAFKVQAQVDVKLAKIGPMVDQARSDIDISALLGMQSKSWVGSIGICFPRQTFLNIVGKMLGEIYPEITDEIADAAGEFLNIVYASARSKINEAGHDFNPAIPSVIRGHDIKMAHGGGMSVVVIQCQSDQGPFQVEIGLKKVDKK